MPAMPRPQTSDPMLAQAKTLVAPAPDGLPITLLSTSLARNTAVQISLTPQKTWRGFRDSHSSHFTCDPKGPTARVRLKP